MLVSFKDRVRMYNIVVNKLKAYQETILKSCKDLKFSHGCQYWAAASGISVIVCDTKSFQPLMTFQGHMMSVQRLLWAPGDQVLFSMGLDGNVYGWMVNSLSNPVFGSSSSSISSTVTANADNRIDIVTANNRASTLTSLVIDCPTTSFHKPGNKNAIHNDLSIQENNLIFEADHRSQLILSSVDGNMKLPSFSLDRNQNTSTMPFIYGDPRSAISCLTMTRDRRYLLAGTMAGTIRIYLWPMSSEGSQESSESAAIYVETLVHCGPVTSIALAPHELTFITTGEDGCLFVHNFLRGLDYERSLVASTQSKLPIGTTTSAAIVCSDLAAEDSFSFNKDVMLVSSEELDEHVNEVLELHKQIADLKAKHSYEVNELQASHAEELKKHLDRHESILYEEQIKYETMKQELDAKVAELSEFIDQKDVEYIKRSTELENRYEHKLADQFERYDSLAEEMESLRQNCESLLREERLRAEKMMADLHHESHMKEKKLTFDNKRLTEDKKNEANTFQEILEQQENEYEDELKQLITAAESELGSEREIVLNLRTIIQTKNTKLDQMKKKLEEVNSIAKARFKLLEHEKAEKMKLVETLEHYKHNLKEREEVLSEKEKIISELRNSTRTLENFRFVLDHRLQQLSAERGPITNHIERLERHIRTMYEELVEEFDQKKVSNETMVSYENKLARITKELTNANYEISLKERYISSFQRDLENIIASVITGKELEDAVQQVHKKYIRNAKNLDLSASGSVMNANAILPGETTNNNLLRGNPKIKEKLEQLLTNSTPSLPGNFNLSSPTGTTSCAATGGSQDKKFIKDVEEALIDTAKESDRQRIFKEREVRDLRHRLETAKTQNERMSRRLVRDNNNILAEYNDLRKYAKSLEHQLNVTKEALKEMQLNQGHSTSSHRLASAMQSPAGSIDLDLVMPLPMIHPPQNLSSDQISISDSTTAGGSLINAGAAGAMFNLPTNETIQPQQQMNDDLVTPHSQNSLQKGFDMRFDLHKQANSNQQESQPRSNQHSFQTNDSTIAATTAKLIAKTKSLTGTGTTSSANNRKEAEREQVDGDTSPISGLQAKKLKKSNGMTALSPKVSSKLTPIQLQKQKIAGATHIQRQHELVVQRLGDEIEGLHAALDDARREKDMQRFELGRLRKQVAELMTRLQDTMLMSRQSIDISSESI
jgi:WD40 repeat protein